MEDVLVIGGGPAGAACALWLHQLGMAVRLLEAGPAVGGLQLRSPYTNRWIPGVQGKTGQEVAAELHAHLCDASVPHSVDFHATAIRRDAAAGTWEVSGRGHLHRARHLVLATGSTPRAGGFEESANVGIGPGLSMERIEVRGRRVAILGGGDNAFDQAAFAASRGAARVDIYCRRRPRAQPLLQRQVDPDCVHVGPFEADPRTMTVNGRPCDVIGVQFGFQANIPAGMRLPLHGGYIDVDRRGAVPGHPGLYAAGEVTNFWHPCVTTAYAHGVQVAKSIHDDHLAWEEEAMPPPAATSRSRPAAGPVSFMG